MTVIHIGELKSWETPNRLLTNAVLFKFRADVSAEHKETFVRELKTLRELPCVKNKMLWVGSPSVTNPIEKSQGFEIALASFHPDLAALEEYQASKEHEKYVTLHNTFPFRVI